MTVINILDTPVGIPTQLNHISSYYDLSQGRIEDLTTLLSKLIGTPITTQETCKWITPKPPEPADSNEAIKIKDEDCFYYCS